MPASQMTSLILQRANPKSFSVCVIFPVCLYGRSFKIILSWKKQTKLFPSGIEPETFCVLGRCDNRYTTET